MSDLGGKAVGEGNGEAELGWDSGVIEGCAGGVGVEVGFGETEALGGVVLEDLGGENCEFGEVEVGFAAHSEAGFKVEDGGNGVESYAVLAGVLADGEAAVLLEFGEGGFEVVAEDWAVLAGGGGLAVV